jgi:predicted nucleotidyltransferase
MVKWNILEEIKRNPNVITLGVFGSAARNEEGRDIDVFVLAKGDIENIREKLLKAGFDPTVNQIQELEESDPIFLAALIRSFKPIKGELKLQIDNRIVENRLRLAVVHYLMRLREGIDANEYRQATILNAFNTAQYASWLLLYKHGLPLPANSTEILTLLRKTASKTLLNLFQNSILASIERNLDVSKTKLKNKSLLYTMLSATEALKMTTNPLKEAEQWIKHVQKRAATTDPKDTMSIRELCQDLFIAIYNATRAYLNAKKGYAPETHVQIFHALEGIKTLDPNAAKIEEDYRQAFHTLHVDCHYRGIGTLNLVKKWINKTLNLINHIKTIT